jgi:hypothetical protein
MFVLRKYVPQKNFSYFKEMYFFPVSKTILEIGKLLKMILKFCDHNEGYGYIELLEG